MSIIKNEIPLLEFDDEQGAVINPTHEKLDLRLPRKCVFAFLGEYISEYAEGAGAVKVSDFISMTKHYPVYIIQYKGEEITLCEAPVGAAASSQVLDWLIGYTASIGIPGTTMMLDLMCAKGREPFYEKHGFVRVHESVVITEHFACDVKYIKDLV